MGSVILLKCVLNENVRQVKVYVYELVCLFMCCDVCVRWVIVSVYGLMSLYMGYCYYMWVGVVVSIVCMRVCVCV